MKRFVVLLVLSLALGACGPALVSVGPPYGASPGYVYTYPEGGCWADDAWYAQCPWAVGPQAGYYYRHQSHYYWHPRPAWQYRPGSPPPRVRDHRPPSRHRMVHPPRVRDHRRHR